MQVIPDDASIAVIARARERAAISLAAVQRGKDVLTDKTAVTTREQLLGTSAFSARPVGSGRPYAGRALGPPMHGQSRRASYGRDVGQSACSPYAEKRPSGGN